ncbi:lytic transglycosylase domain-containing protein [bacterium]|nr:lytic transglycosylase domain-containing protein [bacterium]
MFASSLLIFQLLFSAFQFDFGESDIEKHIDQKILYLRQFSTEERIGFCNRNDSLSCKILFLETVSEASSPVDDLTQLLEKLDEKDRELGIYLLVTERWQDLPLEIMKGYIAQLSEQLSKNLYPIYLRKLYYTGRIKEFMEDYRQTKSPDLTQYYVTELLKKNPEEGFAYLRQIKVDFPESFYDTMAKTVENYSKKLSKKAVGEFRIWQLEYNYRKVRYKQAISLANGFYPNKKYSNSVDWRAHLYRAMSYSKRREHTKAEAIYRDLEKHWKNEELSLGDIYKFFIEYGYSESALVHNAKAIELYMTAYEFFLPNDEESASEFLYLAADIARLDRQWDESTRLFSLYISSFPGGRKIELASFLSFWISYKQNRLDDAKQRLDEIIAASHELSYDRQRANYWLARVLEKQNKSSESTAIFCDLATRFPASFYGAMAASRVKTFGFSCKEPEETQTDPGLLLDRESIPETGWITASICVNKPKLTNKILSNSLKNIENDGHEYDKLVASFAAKSVNNHILAANLMKSINRISDNSQKYFKLHYTIAFEEEILSHCDFYNVPPLFVFSIARQESLFDVGAISTSYAIGLLQLLPSTAQILANSEDYGTIETKNLQKPLTNIRFGVKYLSTLLKKFDRSIPLAAASYNAGEKRIEKWIKNNPDAELDEYIEDIPIFQTRNYVKKVVGNYAVYSYIFYDKVYDELEFKLPKK